MFSNDIESYQADGQAWDGWLVTVLIGAMQARSIEVLIVVGLLFGVFMLAGAVLAAIVWFAQHIATFVANVYANRAQAGPQLARVIPLTFVGVILTWLFSFLFYDRGMIPWGIHINILAFSYLMFAFAMVWMHGREEQGAQQVAAVPLTTRIKSYLPWKKQP